MLKTCEAVELLLKGDVIILPTDTLYGLAAIAYDYDAVKKVFDLKNREYSKPLPVHYSDIRMVENDCLITEFELDFMEKYWPGPLTIVLRKKASSSLKFVGESVAARIPNSAILLDVLKATNQPLVMPSANISGCENMFKFEEINREFNLHGIENDSCLCRLHSTVVSFSDEGSIQVLRKGAVEL